MLDFLNVREGETQEMMMIAAFAPSLNLGHSNLGRCGPAVPCPSFTPIGVSWGGAGTAGQVRAPR